MIERIKCFLFRRHKYVFAIGTQYICDHCGKVVWKHEKDRYDNS